MDCQRVRSELCEYAAGEMPAGRHRDLAAHLRDCPNCHKALEAELSLRDAAREALEYSGPVYSFAQLKRRMAAIEPLHEVLVLLPRLQKIGVVPRFAVALGLLVFYGGVAYAVRNSGELYDACREPKLLAQREFVGRELTDIYKSLYVDGKKHDAQRDA